MSVWENEEILEVEREFAYPVGTVKSMIEMKEEEEQGENQGYVAFDMNQVLNNPIAERVKAAVDFLSPQATEDDADEWGDYAKVAPPSFKKIETVTIASEIEARATLFDPEWCQDSFAIVEVMSHPQVWSKLLNVLEEAVNGGTEGDKLLAALFESADKSGYLEIMADIFVITSRNPLIRMELISTMLRTLSRRVLLNRSPQSRARVYNALRDLLIDTQFIAALQSFDNRVQCLQRWFACQATRLALMEQLPPDFDFHVIIS